MKSGLSFLIAARHCEIEELDQLARTSQLAGSLGRLVHGLQRERGLSNVLLVSRGQRFAQQRNAQIGECLRLEHELRTGFDELETDHRRVGNGTRLFSRIGWVLAGLDALPALRHRVGALEIEAAAATAAYAKLIAGLLAVVFEAADGATDPEISRLLAATFNFMQGKEYAGQERACGAAAFAEGHCDAERRQSWLQLITAQERCFRDFAEFADPKLAEIWQRSQPVAELAELERLRRVACAAPADSTLDAELSTVWFDCSSLRIDAMKAVEDDMAAAVRDLCERKMTQARAQTERDEALLRQAAPESTRPSMTFFDEADAADAPRPIGTSPFGHQVERGILDMLHEQTQRVQSISDELDTVRAALNERKLVERAKGLLMAHRRMSEQEAHQMLRQTAMNQNRRLVDVAEAVLAMAEFLPDGGPP